MLVARDRAVKLVRLDRSGSAQRLKVVVAVEPLVSWLAESVNALWVEALMEV